MTWTREQVDAAAMALWSHVAPPDTLIGWDEVSDRHKDEFRAEAVSALAAASALAPATPLPAPTPAPSIPDLINTTAGLALASASWGEGFQEAMHATTTAIAGATWEQPENPYTEALLRMIRDTTTTRETP